MEIEWDEGIEGDPYWRPRLSSPMTIHVVGVSYVEGYPDNLHSLSDRMIEQGIEPAVALIRDPGNPYDSNAIMVYVEEKMLGHVPRTMAAQLAPLIDEGEHWSGRVRYVATNPDNPEQPGIIIEAYRESER